MDGGLKFDLGFGGVDIESVKRAWAKDEAKIQSTISTASNLELVIKGVKVKGLDEAIQAYQNKIKPIKLDVSVDTSALKDMGDYYDRLEKKIQGDPLQNLKMSLREIREAMVQLEKQKMNANILEAQKQIDIYKSKIKELQSQPATGWQLTANIQEIEKYNSKISELNSLTKQYKANSATAFVAATPTLDKDIAALNKEYSITTEKITDIANAQQRLAAQSEVYEKQKLKLSEYRGELQKLEQQYNELATKGEVKTSTGELTPEARVLAEEYTRINGLLQEQVKSIQVIAREEEQRNISVIRQIEKEDAAITKKIEKEDAANKKRVDAENQVKAVLDAEANSLDVIDKKTRILNEQRSKAAINSTDYKSKSIEIDKLQAIKAQVAEVERRKKQQIEVNSILKKEENTIANIQAKLQVLNERKATSVFGSATFAGTQTEIDRLTVSLNKMQGAGVSSFEAQAKSAQKLGGILNGMPQFLNQYVSLLGGFRLASNIREITAEFELQRVALGAIIQDRAKADQLFSQITQLAVQSPFQVKDLITYTKELSAYRIETDLLYDTTKRLADISAGLGVDMGRLILAYGQVSAASVLRGQELRQFTEAGIPLVSLLADKFTQLRGEMVSTGEVFELISNRAVSFGMVKEIFADMTNAGGTFYNMQKIQAETLAGSWSNLKDEIDLAMNAMGENNYESMKTVIDTTKDLWRNWEIVFEVLTDVGIAYGAYQVAMIATAKTNAQVNTQLGIQNSLSMKQILADGQLAAGKDRLAAIQMKIAATTEAEKAAAQGLINSIENTNKAYLKRMLLSGEISKNQAIQLILTKQTTAAQRELFIQTSVLTRAEVNQAVVETGLIKTKNLLQLGIARVATGFKKLWAVLSANVWLAAIAGLVLLAKTIYTTVTAADKLNNELRNIKAEGFSEAEQLDAKFKRLAGVVTDTSKTISEQNAALSELQNTYRDIIPAHQLTTDALIKMKGVYTDVTAAIYAKIKAQKLEKGLSAIEAELAPDIKIDFNDLNDNFIDYVEGQQKNGRMLKVTHDDILRGLSEFKRQVEQGEITISGGFTTIKDHAGMLRDVRNEYVDLFKIMKQATGESFNVESMSGFTMWRGALKNINQLIGGIEKYQGAYKKFKDETEMSFSPLVPKGGAFAAYDDFIKVGGEREKAFAELTQKEGEDYVAFIDRRVNAQKDIYTNFLKSIEGKEGENKVIETVKREIAKIDFTPLQKGINKTISDFAKLNNVPTDVFKELFMSGEDSIDAYITKLDQMSTKTRNYVTQLQTSDFQLTSAPNEDVLKTEVLRAELQAKLIKGAKGTDKPKEPSDNRLSILKEEVSQVETVYSKYKELVAFMGSSKARDEVAKLFGQGGKVKGTRFELPFTKEDIQKTYKDAQNAAKNLPKSEKAVMEFGLKWSDQDFDTMKQEIKTKLAALQSEIDNQQKANKFFESILGMTGDEKIATDITVSVFGSGFKDTAFQIRQQLMSAFDGMDISLELGGDTIDYTGLLAKAKKLPEEQRKIAESIISSERTILANYLESLYKTFPAFQSFEERRTAIAKAGAAERAKISQESGLGDSELSKMLEGSIKKEQEATVKINIEEFKASDDWVKTFENIDQVATPSLMRVKERLKELIDTNKEASPTEMKALTDQYIKFSDEIDNRNPFKAISDGVKEYIEASADVEAKTAEQVAAINAITLAEQELTLAIDAKNAAYTLFLETEGSTLEAGAAYAAAGAVEKAAIDKVAMSKTAAAKSATALSTAEDKQKASLAKTVKGMQAAAAMCQTLSEFLKDVTNLFGIAEDTEVGIVLNSMAESLGMVASVLMIAAAAWTVYTAAEILADVAGKSLMATLWPLLVVMLAVAAVMAIFSLKSAKANKEIAKQEKIIGDLQYAHSRLQKASEQALGVDYIQNYNEQYQNLLDQSIAKEKQAAAERSKGKKKDKERAEELMKESRDLHDQATDMADDFAKKMLGVGLGDFAKEVASIWLEARLAGEDTMDALNKKWKEMMNKMVKETIMAKAIERHLKPIFAKIDELNTNPNLIDNKTWLVELGTLMGKSMEDSAKELEAVFKALKAAGYDFSSAGGDLTGIAKDVSQASESQIVGLAAGINTQNSYFAKTVSIASNIFELMILWDQEKQGGVGIGTQRLLYIQMDALEQLVAIEKNTSSSAKTLKLIDDKLDSVINSRGVLTGKVVKTELM